MQHASKQRLQDMVYSDDNFHMRTLIKLPQVDDDLDSYHNGHVRERKEHQLMDENRSHGLSA